MTADIGPSRPLSGVRVVDLTANMAGPFATQILADQGADVIKVEPPEGDVSRTLGNGSDGYSAFYANLNRSKRAITVDLGHVEAGRLLVPLLDGADVVVHSYRPGAARRFGVDSDQARAGRPALIHATITGFGSVGPFAGRPAYDHVIQAITGFAAAQADPQTGEPGLVRQGVVDKLVGQTAAQAITAALFERTRSGAGRSLEIRMLDAALAFLWPDAMMNHTVSEPDVVRPPVARSFRLTRTRDGYVAFIVVTGRQFERLAAGLGVGPGAPDGPSPRGPAGPAGLFQAAARRLARCTTAEGVDLLASFDIPVAPVVPLDRLHDHPQTRASGAVDEFDHPVLGHVRQANPAARFDDHTASTMRPAPQLGQHNLEIAAELGLDEPEVHRLRAAGVFGPLEGS